MKQPTAARNPAMDIVRCFALFCVVSVHFFMYSGYYNTSLVGIRMYIMTFLLAGCRISSALFLILSGYLMKNKTPTRQYYSKIIETFSIYILASLCCYYYSRFTNAAFSGSGTLSDALMQTLGFQAAPYAWYMEMYIGLFLLIPYLNILYNNLPSQKNKLGLILVLIILTAIPQVTNIFTYSPEQGLYFSLNTVSYQALLSDWWIDLFPITYYFLGCYLRDHPLKISRLLNFVLLIFAVALFASFVFLTTYNDSFRMGPWQADGSLFNVLVAVPLFNLLAQGRYNWLGATPRRFLARISGLCFGAYLVSWVFDDAFYPILDYFQPVFAYKILYFPVITCAVYICSLILSAVLNRIYDIAEKLITTLYRKVTVHT